MAILCCVAQKAASAAHSLTRFFLFLTKFFIKIVLMSGRLLIVNDVSQKQNHMFWFLTNIVCPYFGTYR
jgi:hypothetical protein